MSTRLRSKAIEGLRQMIKLADDSIGYLRAHGASKRDLSTILAGRDYAKHLIDRSAERTLKRAK